MFNLEKWKQKYFDNSEQKWFAFNTYGENNISYLLSLSVLFF